MTYEVRIPTAADLKLFYEAPALPQIEEVWGLFLDGELVAIAGTLPDPHAAGSVLEEDGRTIGFLNVKPGLSGNVGFDIVRRLRAWLNERGRVIWIQQDDAFPTSQKLLRALGFGPTHQTRRDLQNTGRNLRMWVWRPMR